jgi:DNA-binding transcriptional MerR regulator
MRPPPWKVGELALQTGLSVRTLHHYDEIGLLVPSYRTESGHRLYATADVARLQQIKSLRQLGFSLEQVRDFLDRPDFSAVEVVRLHLKLLREQTEAQRRLCDRLERLAAALGAAEEVSAAELVRIIEDMTMFEKYYTPEQLEQLKQRAAQVGEERIRQVEAEWPQLMAQVRAEMDKGTDPYSETVQALARRWRELVREFTGGDPALTQSLKTMYQQEPTVHGMDTGPVREMAAYVARALSGEKSSQ